MTEPALAARPMAARPDSPMPYTSRHRELPPDEMPEVARELLALHGSVQDLRRSLSELRMETQELHTHLGPVSDRRVESAIPFGGAAGATEEREASSDLGTEVRGLRDDVRSITAEIEVLTRDVTMTRKQSTL